CKSATAAGESCRRQADARPAQRATRETAAAKGTAREVGAADPRHAQGAIAKARAAETRHPERATATEACATPGKAYPPATSPKSGMPAKASAMTAKAPAMSAAAACIGFEREKRNEEEQYRGHAGAARHLRPPGLIARLQRRVRCHGHNPSSPPSGSHR